MRRWALGAACTLGLVWGCGGDAPSTPSPAAPAPATPAAQPAAQTGGNAAGQRVYTQYCVSCHQADGSGMNGMLAANFKTEPERLQAPDDELLAVIRDGRTGRVGNMPGWGSVLNDEQQRAVLAYMKESFGQ